MTDDVDINDIERKIKELDQKVQLRGQLLMVKGCMLNIEFSHRQSIEAFTEAKKCFDMVDDRERSDDAQIKITEATERLEQYGF